MKQFLLFLAISCNITYAQVSDFKHIDFTRADNIAVLNQGESLKNLPVLTHKLTSQLPTEVEKFRAIHSWICNNIKGDPIQHDLVDKKRRKFANDSIGFLRWNDTFKKTAFKKLLDKKKTMCTGYAYLVKEMCLLANIEAKIISGYGRTAESNVRQLNELNHSWNAIKLDNKWYLCDATWSSGYMIGGVIFEKDYNDGYFLADPKLYAKSHYPLQKKWLLVDDLIRSDYIARPLVYGETFKQNINPVYPEKMNLTVNKNSEITFSFQASKHTSTDNIDLVTISSQKEKTLKIYDVKSKNGIIQFKYLFKHKGLHDVHLRINNDIVATYTIKVQKSKTLLY